MNRNFTYAFLALSAVLWTTAALAAPVPEGPESAREYWKSNFPQISPDHPDAQKAVAVFRKVLAAADKKKGIDPELVLIDEKGYPWAKSIPDGGIILTRGAIEICYKDVEPEVGKARLAFVLGHEISHQVNGDFWHYFFYQGLHPDRVKDKRSKEILEGVISMAKKTDNIQTRELAADQYGIIYASQAGYKVNHLVQSDTKFFRQWVASTNPKLVEGIELAPNHPSTELRTAIVQITVQKVLNDLPDFERGIKEYDKKNYGAAVRYFERFIQSYQSREVYNNLGLCHFHLAAQALSKWAPERVPPYKLSLNIDRVSRARSTMRTARKGEGYFANVEVDYRARFEKQIEKAIRYFTEASNRDPYYPISRNNLGNTYILAGKYSKAVGEFKESLGRNKEDAETYNNLGVGLLLLGEELGTDTNRKVLENFLTATRIDPKYKDPYYNLALYHNHQGDRAKAERYATRYLKLDPSSPDAATLRRTLRLRAETK